MTKYILNHYYKIQHDKKRSYIIAPNDLYTKKPIKVDSGWNSKIHPAYAMMLSFFSQPVTIEEAAEGISKFFSTTKEATLSYIQKLAESNEPNTSSLGGFESGFPTNIIIKASDEFVARKQYNPSDFKFEDLDFNSARMFMAPLSIVFMPNNNCMTNCVYCYADKTHHRDSLEFSDIHRFVSEARSIGVRDILITGGDYFMYPKWQELLELLIKFQYTPDLISTKVPINQKTIEDFEKYKIRAQISLDSVSEEVNKKVLRVDASYTPKILSTIENIDKSSISYQIATVITNINDSIEELEKIARFVRTLKRVERWEVRVAFRSLYSHIDFDQFRCAKDQLDIIEAWVEQIKESVRCEVLWSPSRDKEYQITSGGSENFPGPFCTANTTNMMILPNGEVTICEQLYWHEHFIIGNVKEATIADIWTGKKALSLWNLQQNKISELSPCKRCKDFDKCFEQGNRCYADIMKAYGKQNHDFPDPRCIFAPKFYYKMNHE